MRHLAVLASIAAIPATAGNVAAGPASAPVIGCAGNSARILALAQPLHTGRFALHSVHCLDLPSSSFPVSPPRPSPDGRGFFVFDHINGLRIGGTVANSASRHFPGRVTALPQFLSTPPFAWAGNGQAVLGVAQRTAHPAGWALGPLTPALFRADGKRQPLPVLKHPAGPLDQLFWAGDRGKAVAAFGTRGSYYCPEHDDPRPTLALTDARAGRVIDAVEIASIPGLAKTARVMGADSIIDARGRIRSLISFAPDKWVSWTEGAKPQVAALDGKAMQPFALAPDGSAVLMMKNLSATGMICERDPHCPRPTPGTGVIAELRALPGGRVIWAVSGTARTFSRSDVPSISPDGRYALISMPADEGDGTIALVAMATGELLQQFPRPSQSECASGFSPDGMAIWISGGARIATYKIGGK